NPNVDLAARLEICGRAPELKVRRQHPDHRVALVVQRDGLADDGAVGAKPFAPGDIAQNRDAIVAGPILFRKKIAAQYEPDAEYGKETRRSVSSGQPRRLALPAENEAGREAGLPRRPHPAERPARVAPI